MGWLRIQGGPSKTLTTTAKAVSKLGFVFFFRSSECCGCAQIATAGRKFSVGKVEKPRLPWERSLVYLRALRVLRPGGDCVWSTNARIIADGVSGEKCGTAAWCSALSPAGESNGCPYCLCADVGGMLRGRPGMQPQWAVSLQKRNRDRGAVPSFGLSYPLHRLRTDI